MKISKEPPFSLKMPIVYLVFIAKRYIRVNESRESQSYR